MKIDVIFIKNTPMTRYPRVCIEVVIKRGNKKGTIIGIKEW